MADMNKQALEMWGAMKPMIDKEIEAKTQGVVQRRKAKVTTAPSLITNKIGVTEPFGSEYFVPFNTNIMSAQVGDVVWVEFMYGATNAFASLFAGADDKDLTVAGDIHVIGDSTFDGDVSISGDLTVNGLSTFVGDVEFQGNVSGINLTYKMSASLSSAGWYRILYYADTQLATVLDFKASIPESQGSGTESGEVHRIKYTTTNGAYAIFSGEYSVGETLLIDKIRRTYGGSIDGVSAWAFDIHYSGNSARTVYVELSISGNFDPDLVFLQDLAAVADAPSGESVYPAKNLAQRTEGDISSLCSINRTSGSSGVDSFTAVRHGNVVALSVNIKTTASISQGGTIFIGTFSGPTPSTDASACVYNGQRVVIGRFLHDGTIDIRMPFASSSMSSGGTPSLYFNYLTD